MKLRMNCDDLLAKERSYHSIRWRKLPNCFARIFRSSRKWPRTNFNGCLDNVPNKSEETSHDSEIKEFGNLSINAESSSMSESEIDQILQKWKPNEWMKNLKGKTKNQSICKLCLDISDRCATRFSRNTENHVYIPFGKSFAISLVCCQKNVMTLGKSLRYFLWIMTMTMKIESPFVDSAFWMGDQPSKWVKHSGKWLNRSVNQAIHPSRRGIISSG
jgi:hypothetical protein